ncbi:MAG: hypothetical protein C4582_10620 [Desulfobacteraceae bacterium]|nr:MAG: hypothetical protein C4582_10620 [Desulfobacteraceae bacterium]
MSKKAPLKNYLACTIISVIVLLWACPSFAVDWKALSTNLIEHFKPKILSIEKLDQKSCWAVVLPETSVDDALKLAKEVGEYIKANIPPETNPKPMVRIFVAGKQVAVAVLDGESYRAVQKSEKMDPAMFKGQYRPQ